MTKIDELLNFREHIEVMFITLVNAEKTMKKLYLDSELENLTGIRKGMELLIEYKNQNDLELEEEMENQKELEGV